MGHGTSRRAVIALTAIFAAMALVRLCAGGFDHGDEYSDADAMSAGRNFSRLGFIATRFLPVYEPHLDSSRNAYTHAPPLADILNGVQRRLFRTDGLFPYRLVSLCLSWLSVLMWYFLVVRLTGSVSVAFLAALFYLANPYFVYGMDSLREIAYADFLRNAIMLLYVVFAGKEFRGRLRLCALFVLTAALSLVTFEYIIYLSIFFIAYAAVCVRAADKRLGRRAAAWLLAAPVAGFVIHLAQNIWYFGSVAAAVGDLKNICFQRMLNSADSFAALSLPAWFELVLARNFSLAFVLGWFSLLLLAVFGYVLYSGLDKNLRKTLVLPARFMLIMAACGVSWYVFFPSHSLAHAFVNFLPRHLTPAASLFFALSCYVMARYISSRGEQVFRAWILPGGICAIICGMGIAQSQLPYTPARMAASRDYARFQACMEELKRISSPHDVIGINYYRFPPVRYYADRRVKAVFTGDSLSALEKLPEYFLFLPYMNDQAKGLFNELNEKYSVIFKCTSEQFPVVCLRIKS